MTTNYDRGRAFEYRVRDDMRRRGYWAQRSPRSGTEVDVYAYHMGVGFFIQAKRDGYLSQDERKALVALAREHNAIPLFARPVKLKGKRRSGLLYRMLPDVSPFDPPTFK